ncbi:DUF543 domain-containing protein [Chloropicon roscoffensis]|uniref:DUF543 domain-containing protein n=1 Tax=Chloropicon roscoffensis TaxID=1461544 RepID=A0AAX4NY98_9CHLO
MDENKFDRVVENVVRGGTYGALAGAAAALLLFRHPSSRSCVFTFGLGCGMGAAYSDAAKDFGALFEGVKREA